MRVIIQLRIPVMWGEVYGLRKSITIWCLVIADKTWPTKKWPKSGVIAKNISTHRTTNMNSSIDFCSCYHEVCDLKTKKPGWERKIAPLIWRNNRKSEGKFKTDDKHDASLIPEHKRLIHCVVFRPVSIIYSMNYLYTFLILEATHSSNTPHHRLENLV